jgi:hypothetical protein
MVISSVGVTNSIVFLTSLDVLPDHKAKHDCGYQCSNQN